VSVSVGAGLGGPLRQPVTGQTVVNDTNPSPITNDRQLHTHNPVTDSVQLAAVALDEAAERCRVAVTRGVVEPRLGVDVEVCSLLRRIHREDR
jgi:hypothetical protein